MGRRHAATTQGFLGEECGASRRLVALRILSSALLGPPAAVSRAILYMYMSQTTLSALATRMAKALGLDPSEFGGKSFRIGGATDLRSLLGADSERIIKQRGRWHSDVALAYQRALARQHLSASSAVADVDESDLEALCPGWAQRG